MESEVILLQLSDFGLGRGLYLAKAMSSLGSKVTVITNKPVYRPLTNRSNTLEAQKEYSSSNTGMKIIDFDIPFAETLYESVFGRAIVYIVFMILSFVLMSRETPRPKILYSRGPHPFTDITCILYKAFCKNDARIISDTTDLWPDALANTDVDESLKHHLIAIGHTVNGMAYSKIDVVVTHDKELGKILQARFRRPTHIIYGAIDLDVFRPLCKKKALETLSSDICERVAGKFIILNAGLLGIFQNPFIVLEMAKKLVEDKGILFIVVGTGPLKESVVQKAKESEVDNILFLETQPFEKMPFVYNLADLFLMTYASMRFLRIGLPKKFIEYAACGKPILCVSPACVASSLCQKWKAGYHALPQEIENAVHFIRALKEDEELRECMGKNARGLAEDLFSLNHAADTLKKIIYNLR